MTANVTFKKPAPSLDFGRFQETQTASTFWTREDGQVSVQSFRPETDLLFQPHTYAEYTLAICLEGQITKSQLGQAEMIVRGEATFGNHGVEHTSSYRFDKGNRCEAVDGHASRIPFTGLNVGIDYRCYTGIRPVNPLPNL